MERTTTTDAPALWVARLIQASDSMYPTGGYAHSHGVEGLIQDAAVRDIDGFRAFLLEQVLPSLARTDLAVAAHAWNAASDPVDWKRLRELCLLGSALRGAREPREASEAIGRQRIELAARLRGGIAGEFKSRAESEGWPVPACVAAAVEARAIGAPRDAALAALLYSSAAGLVSAAMKLLRFGQNAAQSLIADSLALAPELISEALRLEPDEIGAFNPWWDIAAARHESADFRLFIS